MWLTLYESTFNWSKNKAECKGLLQLWIPFIKFASIIISHYSEIIGVCETDKL